MRITNIVIKDYRDRTSGYIVNSKTGCAAANLMPRKVLTDLILELIKISNKRIEKEITVLKRGRKDAV